MAEPEGMARIDRLPNNFPSIR